jgi:xanthine/uracil permease
MKNIIKSGLLVATIFALNVEKVLADSNGVYTPYEPHEPIDTGLENSSLFYIIASVLFVLGLATLSTAKILKEKLSE